MGAEYVLPHMVSRAVRVLPSLKDGFDPLAPDLFLQQSRLAPRETVPALCCVGTRLKRRAGEFGVGGRSGAWWFWDAGRN